MTNKQLMLETLDKFSSAETSKVSIMKHEYYDDVEFHCVTVPSGMFVIRSDGKISVTGNCIHMMASAYCFRKKLLESNLTTEQAAALEERIRASYRKMFEHETAIIKKVFAKGSPDGITELQMVHFVQSRINECLIMLGYTKEYEVKYNPIAEWFYDAINNFSFNDFFSGMGNSYQRDWDASAFTWKTKNKEVA